ncbi:hypothetical protein QOZ80_1BG0061310 [Eleusine coracana subsp. coracana]|nr:hypothetical protein QOZ80_1BG0061310 [Eleusine coracana subsp. coracana]
MAAASLGLGHEAYTYPPDLLVANNCAATMNFMPPAAMAGDCFPELSVHPTDYYSPTTQAVFAENEMNIRGFVDDGRMTMSRAAGTGHRAPPSSRIGFRTRSEVDVLDDGFKWRKYGKKAVKSSPNPRNYYRCSVEGCGVKKRVERDSADPRYVVTTYDGVHNHAAPGHHHGAPQQQAAAPYTAAMTSAAAPCPDLWGMQMQPTTAHSSESSY